LIIKKSENNNFFLKINPLNDLMRVKLYLIFLFAITYVTSFSQDTWIKGYNPFHDPYDDWVWDTYSAEDVLLLNDGNYLISATYEYGIEYYYYERFGMLMKVDTFGDTIWTVKDSVSFLSEAVNVFTIEDNDGYIYSYCADEFSPGSYLNKRNSDGELIWTHDIFDKKYKDAYLSQDNHLILGGWQYVTQTTVMMVVDKMNTDGEIIWHQEYSTANNSSTINSIIQCSNSDIVFCGYIPFGNAFIHRVSSEGDSIWLYEFNDGDNVNNLPKSIIETSNSEIIVSGMYSFSNGWDGYLAFFSPLGDNIGIQVFPNTSEITCVVEDEDNSVVFNSHLFTKYNYITDEIDFERQLVNDNFPNAKIGNGDCNIIKINGGYIISGFTRYDGNYLLLFKTDENGEVTSSFDSNLSIGYDVKLNYQNPFFDAVEFEIIRNDKEININRIDIYNIKGQKVTSLSSSSNKITWNSSNNSTGIYFIRLNKAKSYYKLIKRH